MTFTQVTLTRDYDTPTGEDPAGYVTLTPTAPMVNSGVTVVAAPIRANLDVDGHISVTLTANTDPDTLPTTAAYLVTEKIVGQAIRQYYVVVPHDAGGTLDLGELDPSDAAPPSGSALSAHIADTDPHPGLGLTLEEIRDTIGTTLVEGTGIDITVNDGADTVTIAATGGAYTDEQALDAVGSALVEGAGIDITVVDDPTDTITIASTITQYTDEMARDALGTALTAGSGITVTPNDGSDTITIASTITQYTDELARDALGTALVGGTGITVTPNDGSDTITVTATGGGGSDHWTVLDPSGGDDTAAIQAAIDAAYTTGGGTVYLRGNTYTLSADLVMKRRVILRGDGIAAGQADTGTILFQTSTTEHGITAVDQQDMTLQDLTLVGPGSGSGTGIRFTRSINPDISGLTLRRVQVSSFGGSAIELSNPITSTFERVLVDGCNVGFNVHGVTGGGGSAGTSCTFLNCYAAGITQSGFRLDNMTYCAFVGCAADACGISYELIESGTQGISFVGCGCESMVTDGGSYPGIGWKINAAVGVVLTGCYTFDQPNISIWITGNANAVNVTAFSENTAQVGATNSIKVDSGSIVTVSGVAVDKPMSLAGTVTLVDDGGGMTVPGYLFVGGTTELAGKATFDAVAVLANYTTGGRPSASTSGVGAMAYDTTLSIPIWSNGTVWKNAAGTTV